MALMLPEVISPKVRSRAEQRVFRWFESDRRTKDWIVMHSLGIESNFNRAYSEMDFLVLAPGLGIFALEVKGGGVKRKNGVWEYTDRFDMNYLSKRSPIDQAKEGMFNVLEYLKKYAENKHLSKLLFGFGLMFPDITFNNDEPDVEQEQFFDVRNRGDIYHYISNLSKYYLKKNQTLLMPVYLPTVADIKEIATLLRPDFDIAVSIEIKKTSSEEEIVHLTQEQYRCIDGLHINPRAIISGYAGSGKSILALKYLKELIAKKVHVAYVCFNPELKTVIHDHIRNELGKSYPHIYDFNGYLETIFDSASLQHQELKGDDFIFAAAEKMSRQPQPAFDVLIIDQAQAFFSDGVLLILDLLLKEGLGLGSWFIFGDFEVHEAFAKEMTVKQLRKMLSPYTKELVVFQLTENCRNNPLIIHEANMFGGIKDLFINPTTIYHHPVEYATFTSESDLVNQVLNINKQLFQYKLIKPYDVIVIDYDAQLNHAVDIMKETKDNKYFKDIIYKEPETMIGLETSIAIIINVNTYHDRYRIYNTLLRARTAVFVLETKIAKQERVEIISNNQKRMK